MSSLLGLRVASVVLLLLVYIHCLDARVPPATFCTGKADGNYLCYDNSKPAVCGCEDGQQCAKGQWYNGALDDCSWSRDFLMKLISCLAPNSEYAYVPTGTSRQHFCANLEDGNYLCDSVSSSELCACCSKQICSKGQWFDSGLGHCTVLTVGLINKLIKCTPGESHEYTFAPIPDTTTESDEYTFAPIADTTTGSDEYTFAPIEDTTTEPIPTTVEQETTVGPVTVCPYGYEGPFDGTHCYKAILQAMTWSEGARKCSHDDPRAHLAAVRDSEEDDAIVGYLKQFQGNGQCYMWGTYDVAFYTSGQRKYPNDCTSKPGQRKDKFVWKLDGGDVNFSSDFDNWQSGEPNCYEGRKENCVLYRCEGDACKWNDYLCSMKACLICQIDLI